MTQQAQADRIALKNLAGEALAQLADHDKREVRVLEELLLDLVDDDEFWAVQANGLAVFATPAGLHTFRLPTRLQPMAEVSDRFHVQPLLRVVTVPQSGFVLALTPGSVRLVEVLPGTVGEDGEVTLASGPSASSYGVVDEIAGRALLNGARVLGVRREDIPGGGSLAAILRYAF